MNEGRRPHSFVNEYPSVRATTAQLRTGEQRPPPRGREGCICNTPALGCRLGEGHPTSCQYTDGSAVFPPRVRAGWRRLLREGRGQVLGLRRRTAVPGGGRWGRGLHQAHYARRYAFPLLLSLLAALTPAGCGPALRIGRLGNRVGDHLTRFATPDDSPLRDCSPYRGRRVRRESLGAVPRSRAIFCRAVPNPSRVSLPLGLLTRLGGVRNEPQTRRPAARGSIQARGIRWRISATCARWVAA